MKNKICDETSAEEFIYYAEDGDTLFSLQERFSVPMHELIYDNMLDREIAEGQAIVIKRGGEVFTLMPDNSVDAEYLKRKNGLEYLYPFQTLYK